MVKDHSDSERGNPLPPHGLLFPISTKGSFICRQDNTYHGFWYTSRGMCYPVHGMMHIKQPLLLIGKSRPCSGGSVFHLSLSECSGVIMGGGGGGGHCLNGHLPYVRRHITVNKMCRVCR